MKEKRTAHPEENVLDQYADQALSVSESREVETHLSVCPSCRGVVADYRGFFTELNRVPAPIPPAGFAVRILDAVLPRPSEDALIIKWATNAYIVLSVVLASVAAGITGVAGPGPVSGAVATGLTRTVSEGLTAFEHVIMGSIKVLTALLDLLPLAGATRTLARGLETSASIFVEQYQVLVVLTLLLATLVLAWATSSVRERGVPHVSLSL